MTLSADGLDESNARQIEKSAELRVGDLVTGIFKGEKPLTYVDRDSVMVQITPTYEQAYFRSAVQKVDSPLPVDPGSRPVHWVGDAPTSLHGNGASSFDFTSRNEAEVTCGLCRVLMRRSGDPYA